MNEPSGEFIRMLCKGKVASKYLRKSTNVAKCGL